MATPALQPASSLALRTLHLTLYPTPRTFPERREVLRMLERYGEVAMFRSLKYHPKTPRPNSFLAIFATESAAQNLLSQSPIRYRMLPSDPSSVSTEVGDTENEQKKEEVESVFQLSASRTNFDHEIFLNSRSTNPRHGPYKPSRYSSIGASLMYSIPRSITSAGMLDWETKRDNAEDDFGKRELGRRANIKTHRVMKGLKDLNEQHKSAEVD